MKLKRTAAVLLIAALSFSALLTSLTSCDKSNIIVDVGDLSDETDTSANEQEAAEEVSADGAEETAGLAEIEPVPEEPVIPEEPKFLDPLTGLETTEELSRQRPAAVMLNNIKPALPQVGISRFDVLYEITVEGAITRLMGLATDWANLPVIGSVRSSRDYFIDVSDAHNALYVHAGGSTYAYNEMYARGTEHVDGTNGTYASTRAFYRDAERMKTMAIEHTLVTTGENLAAAIEGNGFSTAYKDGFVCPFTFASEKFALEGEEAKYIYIPFSYYAQSYLDFDEETGLYSKGQYLNTGSSLDKHDSPHIDGTTGEQLKFDNIIIMRAPHSAIAGDDKGRISVNFTGSGSGYYVSGGKYIGITWKKASRTSTYSLYLADGTTPLVMNPGKTYAAIVPTNADVVLK